MALDRQRVVADEQRLVAGEAGHSVARADADQALVGLDPDDARVDGRPGTAVPARLKGRIERQAMAGDRDGGDLHVPQSILARPDSSWRPFMTPYGTLTAAPTA